MLSTRFPIRPRWAVSQATFTGTEVLRQPTGAWSRQRVTRPGILLNVKRRCYSGELGEGKTGHIRTEQNEGIFFLDNIFPLKLQWFLRIPFINADRSLASYLKRMNSPHLSRADPINVVKRSIPESLPIKVTEIIPRIKEGGAFVKFTHEANIKPRELENQVMKYLKDNPIKPIFNPWRRVRAFLVEGKPWVEDLARFPSPRVKVEFEPVELGGAATEVSQEELYALMRRYGKISDIVPQPVDAKAPLKYATVTFKLSRYAVMARNCLHGFIVSDTAGGGKGGTRLKLTYERIVKAHHFWNWISSHPRVVIPIIAAIIATIAVAIFDPVRTFFVKAHVSRSFHVEDNAWYKWLSSRANDIFTTFRSRRADDNSLDTIWDDRKEDIEQIKTWLIESQDTFVVVTGPRGSGKKELVIDQALKSRDHTLVFDCKPVQEARGDSATICAAAKEVGYRPVFSWMNSFSSMIDLAAQGTIGTKTGLSQTLDAQLAKIFQNTAAALKEIALETRRKDDKDKELSEDDYLDAHPERRPVVVIDNFLHKSNEDSVVYDKISEWAAALVTANVAHVIFLTHDMSFSKSLSKALPDRVFRQISLGDCSAEVAKRYVIRHLDADADTEDKDGEKKLTPSQRRRDLGELDNCIETLGGRLTDLEFLARRIKAGESPKKAVQEIIEQSASEILKMYILDRGSRTWSSTQAWYLIEALALSDQIRYNGVLLADNFKSGGDATLQALEQAELINIQSVNGRPHAIKAGKPVFNAAFRHLTRDHVLKARMDLATLGELIKGETWNIDKYEKELELLAALPKQPAEVTPRVRWLLSKLQTSHGRVEDYERETEKLKLILQKEF